MAATITSKGTTLPDSAQKTDFYAVVEGSVVSDIVNADIDANAAIAATKLAVNSTPGKVKGAGTRGTFVNGDLSTGVLTITHSLGLSTPYTLLLVVADNSQKQIIPDEVTFLTNTITVDLTSYGTLSGTWGYYYL